MRIATVCLIVLALIVSACGRMRHTPEDGASWFFDRGSRWIVHALEEQDASDEQIAAAEGVIERHRPGVTDSLTLLFTEHRQMFIGLASGGDAAALVALEDELHAAHVASLRAIGTMHEEIGEAVGADTWQAAQATMNERVTDRIGDGSS